MTEGLFIACIVIICVVALALAVWLIVTLAKSKREGDAGRVVIVDDTAYVLVRVGEKAVRAEVATREEPAPAPAPEPAPAPVEQPAEEPAAQPAPAEAAPVVVPVAAEEEPAEDTEGMVMLRRNETVPYPEAYDQLSPIERRCVDEILDYAEAKEGSKKVVNDKAASVYYGKKLLVRILLRRGKIVARLTVQNNDFIAYTDKEGLNIKEKPIDVRIEAPETIEHIKNIIDITYNDFAEERARREARRLKREAEKKAEEEAAAAEEQPAETAPVSESEPTEEA